MTIDLNLLRAELDDDLLARGYAGMSDGQAADTFNQADRTRTFRAPTEDIARWFLEQGKWIDVEDLALKQGAFTAATDAQARAARQALATLAPGRLADLDMTKSAVGAGLDALVATGILSTAQKTALQDMSRESISRAAEIGLGRYTIVAAHVAAARAL